MSENTATPTVAEIKEMAERGELKFHHTGSARGYVSRKSTGIVAKYSGKFGEGYTIALPRFDTTQYYSVEYYVNAK